MHPQALCTVKDVDPLAQAWLRHLFGANLPAEQRVLVTLLNDVDDQADSKRREAWTTIHRILDRAAAHVQQVAPTEFDDALDEAMNHVRPRRSP